MIHHVLALYKGESINKCPIFVLESGNTGRIKNLQQHCRYLNECTYQISCPANLFNNRYGNVNIVTERRRAPNIGEYHNERRLFTLENVSLVKSVDV